MAQVGCERSDGLLNVHDEHDVCEVCSPGQGETDDTVDRDTSSDRALLDAIDELLTGIPEEGEYVPDTGADNDRPGS